jgi:hypothetical protein
MQKGGLIEKELDDLLASFDTGPNANYSAGSPPPPNNPSI